MPRRYGRGGRSGHPISQIPGAAPSVFLERTAQRLSGASYVCAVSKRKTGFHGAAANYLKIRQGLFRAEPPLRPQILSVKRTFKVRDILSVKNYKELCEKDLS